MLLERIELSTSPLPRVRSTTELQQQPEPVRRIAAGQARPMAGRPAAVKVRGLTLRRFRRIAPFVSKPPSPADLERERRLAEALRANFRKRKTQAREAKAENPPKD